MAIQLLKRHRDVVFNERQDVAPASIIITTLAAKAYKSELDLLDAIKSILVNFLSGVETIGTVNWVRNPVMSKENFADKWIEDKEKERCFYEWVTKLNKDFEKLFTCKDYDSIINSLRRCLFNNVSTGLLMHWRAQVKLS